MVAFVEEWPWNELDFSLNELTYEICTRRFEQISGEVPTPLIDKFDAAD